MKACPKCSAEISEDARACPKCGHTFSTPAGVVLAVVIGVAIGAVVLLLLLPK